MRPGAFDVPYVVPPAGLHVDTFPFGEFPFGKSSPRQVFSSQSVSALS